MTNLYHVRATLDYLADADDISGANAEVIRAMFDAELNRMTLMVREFVSGDRLPKGWDMDSEVYGDAALTVADCLARLAAKSNQIALPLGANEEESE